ncbi:MAG: hypothetical protein GXY83_28320 [Rhodopirellula sp.]|nr:hypothetical protein [Rhodopirellula sp.]
MKKLLPAVLCITLLFAARSACQAQEPAPSEGKEAAMKPVIALAFSGYDEILGDLRFMNPQLAMMVEGAVDNFTDSKGLEGLDKSRPWGFLVRTDGQEFPMHAFLPVTDLKKLLAALEPAIGEPGDAGEGVYEFETESRVLYAKQVGDWAFVTTTAEGLDDVPQNPAKALGDLPKDFDLGLQVTVKNVPPFFRQMILGMMQMGAQQGLPRQSDESPEDQQLRQKAFEQAMKQFSGMLDELDAFVLGIQIDEKAGLGALEYRMTAIEGSDLAEQMKQTGDLKTDYAGFLMPDAAVTFGSAAEIAQSDIEQVKTQLQTAKANAIEELSKQKLSDEELELAKKLVDELMGVLQKTIEGGKFDVAASAKIAPDQLTGAAGARVVEPERVEEVLKALAKQLIEDEPRAADAIKLDAESFQDVRFHTFAVPLEELENAKGLEKLVGDRLNVVVGVGKQSLYVAAGRDAVAALKQAIEKSKAGSDKPAAPLQLQLALTPIVKTIGSVAEEEQVRSNAEMIAQMLEGSENKDHITVTATSIPQGTKTRVELEQGVLKILGTVPMLLGGMGAPF